MQEERQSPCNRRLPLRPGCRRRSPAVDTVPYVPLSDQRLGATRGAKKKKPAEWVSTQPVRDSLPSRHGRAAQHRASGFIASEYGFNLDPRGRVSRTRVEDAAVRVGPLRFLLIVRVAASAPVLPRLTRLLRPDWQPAL